MEQPERLKRRPQYKGFPIPFTTMVGPDGVPHFKVTDLDAWRICVAELRCALCAEDLDYWVWYLGSREHVKRETFVDMAMHQDCAEYAATVCPYIAHGRAYGNHIEPIEGVSIIELAPRESLSNKGVPMYLARGRRSNIRPSDHIPNVVLTGTLLEAILVERQL